jgi:ketopantoate reductase
MKLCVFGAGAIGGYLAVELALSGNEVCVIARGEHLRAIRQAVDILLALARERGRQAGIYE